MEYIENDKKETSGGAWNVYKTSNHLKLKLSSIRGR